MILNPADRLRQARIAAGFTTAGDAASARQWGAAGYRHHENGIRPYYDIESAVKYARAYRVDLGWLLGLNDTQGEIGSGFNAEALGQVLEALLQAYAPTKRPTPAELLGLGEALKETLEEMLDDPTIAADANRAGFVARTVLRARRRVGQ